MTFFRQILPRLAVCGVALGGLAALPVLAHAEAPRTHTMLVALPDGETARITYAGDVPPRLVLVPEAAPAAEMTAFPFGASPFAVIDQISAEMNQQMAAMLRQVDTLGGAMPGTTGPGLAPGLVNVRDLPQGACFESVTITSTGNGAPHVVRQAAGSCAGAPSLAAPSLAAPGLAAPGGANVPAAQPVPVAPSPRVRLWQARATQQPNVAHPMEVAELVR